MIANDKSFAISGFNSSNVWVLYEAVKNCGGGQRGRIWKLFQSQTSNVGRSRIKKVVTG